MRIKVSAILVVLCCREALWAQQRLALLPIGSNAIVIATGDAKREIATDSRPKSLLLWLPDGSRLSYFVADDKGGLGRLVVIDLDGKILKEVPVRRPKETPSIEPRGIEHAAWVSDRVVRLDGSFNPRNGEVFDLDIDTGRESHDHGFGGSFEGSPDGAHIAYLDLQGTSSDDLRDYIILDDTRVYPKGGEESHIRVLAGPTWSPDSQRFALVVRDYANNRRTDLVTVSTAGKATAGVEVPIVNENSPELTWVDDDRVAVGKGAGMFVVDNKQGTALAPTADAATRVEEARRKGKVLESDVIKLHAKEAVLAPK